MKIKLSMRSYEARAEAASEANSLDYADPLVVPQLRRNDKSAAKPRPAVVLAHRELAHA